MDAISELDVSCSPDDGENDNVAAENGEKLDEGDDNGEIDGEEDFEAYRLRSMNPDDESNVEENHDDEEWRGTSDSGKHSEQDDEPSLPEVPEETEEDMRERIREEERKEKWKKYVEEQCTTLKLVYGSGKRKDFLIHRLLEDYSELQCEIARLHPKSKQLFVCQFTDGSLVRSVCC